MPELVFKGKEFVYNHHLSVPFRPLIPHEEKSIGNASLNDNLIIHGDNLHALKALLPMYAGKIDCVFIDPPYNTGNEGWSYNDNVNSPMLRDWLNSNPINADDGLRHDKWCAMMYPRLRLLSELLATDGIIAVTIDYNELSNLLGLMDEIFGADNHLAVAAWLSDPSGGKQKSALRTGHEYLVIYGGGSPDLTHEEKAPTALDLTDEWGSYAKGRELNKWGANSRREDRPSMYFPLRAPDGAEIYPIRNDGEPGCWRFGESSNLIQSIKNNPDIAHWERRPFDPGVEVDGNSDRWVPYEKIRDEQRAFGWSTWLDKIATNADGTKVLRDIFGRKIFETPKPVELVEWVIGLIPNTDALVLDSFAGSGTTAHAVLTANTKDGGNRKFVLVEMEDYADSLTAERVRRVINGYPFVGTQKDEFLREKITWTKLKGSSRVLESIEAIENTHKSSYDKITKSISDGVLVVTGEKSVQEHSAGLGGKFTFCTLGQPIEMDRILTGQTLPSFESLASVLFHTATNVPLKPDLLNSSTGYVGESSGLHIWLIYKPDLDFLKSRDAALTLAKARTIAGTGEGRHLVFAPARFVSQKLLNDEGLPVEFAPLPFALYRVETE